MKCRKIALNALMMLALGTMSFSAGAVLPVGTTLSIDAGENVPICLDPEDVEFDDPACNKASGQNLTTVRGSHFIMAAGTPNETAVLVSGFNGIVLGSGQPAGTGSHTGFCTAEDTGAIMTPWNFFGNCGHEFSANDGIKTSTATSDPDAIGNVFAMPVPEPDGTEFLDMSNWRVTWNAIPTINMGGVNQDCGTDSDGICVDNAGKDFAGIFINGSALGHLRCYSDDKFTQQVIPCAAGLFYRLEHAAIVPAADPSGFGGVLYQFRLQGNVVAAGAVIAADDTVTTTLGETIIIDVLGNDEPPADLDPASVIVTSGPTIGSAVANPDGSISYTASASVTGADSFTYSVSNLGGTATDSATVSLDVQVNVPPVAGSFTTGATAGVTQNIDMSTRVTDANGNADLSTLEIVNPPSGGGSASVTEDGAIQYTAPAEPGQDLFTYRVFDTAGAVSNTATVNISVTDFVCDAGSLPEENLNILVYETGVPGDPVDSGVPTQSGSFFTMQVDPQTLIFTVMERGPGGGLTLNYEQHASGSHTGNPDPLIHDERPNIDKPWGFFGNTGFHFTANGGVKIAGNGCLDFSRSWIVTWNGIPFIDQGGCIPDVNCPRNEIDLGIGSIACDPAPCADGSHFQLEYAAHVPVGDPSGFGGVPYTLFLNGEIASLPQALVVNNGTLGPGSKGKIRLTADEVDPETEASGVTDQCVGGCFDYEITGVSGASVQVVIPLAQTIPADAQFRVFKGGAWQAFDTSTGDSIKSAPYAPGDGACPAAGPAYVDGLVVGNRCLLVTKSDNGPNDTNPAVGVIADPSGVAVSTIPPPPLPVRLSGDSGCSAGNAAATAWQGGHWWLLLGLAGLWGWVRRRKC